MIKRLKKLSYQDWVTGNTSGTDPIKTFWTETKLVYEPVKLHSFIKRGNGYLFITDICPDTTPPFIVQGYNVTVQQYRYYIISEILGDDLE